MNSPYSVTVGEEKIGSPLWVCKWKKLLTEQIVVRCAFSFHGPVSLFDMDVYLISQNCLYRANFVRWGNSFAQPGTSIEKYEAPLEAFLEDLADVYTRKGKSTRLFMAAKPFRGVVQPRGNKHYFVVPANHPLFMAGYGSVLERIYLVRRGQIGEVTDEYKNAWGDILQRFKAFLHQQQESLLENMIGTVV